ncbi:MAG: hypothetical protein OEY10_00050 [Nitrosopumilus sp.]|nr:hypothetical protein [Nitrosopumilus sp.]
MASKQLVKKTFIGYIAKHVVVEDSDTVVVDIKNCEYAIFTINSAYVRPLYKSKDKFQHPDDVPARKIKVTLIVEEV